MKNLKITLLALLIVSPFFLSAQSSVGSWKMESVTPEGEAIINVVTFGEEGQMTVDFGNDGTVNVEATYKLEGDRVLISDTSDESPCYGKVGIYKVQIRDEVANVTLVEDPCDERRGDGKPGSMKRIN